MAKRIVTLKPFTYVYSSAEPMPEQLLIMDFTTNDVETHYYASEYHELMINKFTDRNSVTVNVDGYEYEIDAGQSSFSIMTDAETSIGTYNFLSYGYEPGLSLDEAAVHTIKVYVNTANVVQIKTTITCDGEYSATDGIYAHIFENGVGTPKRISPAAIVTFKMLCFTGVDAGDEFASGYIIANDWNVDSAEEGTLVDYDASYLKYEENAVDGKYPDATCLLYRYD